MTISYNYGDAVRYKGDEFVVFMIIRTTSPILVLINKTGKIVECPLKILIANSIFKKCDVIFAHCLRNLGGAGNVYSTEKNIYQRINDVFNKDLELSCSTIKSGDIFIQGPLETTHLNYFGPVGIVLCNANITYANPGDGGTMVPLYGKRDYVIDEHNEPNALNIENSILNRNARSYNEFCADTYDIFGIFLSLDDDITLLETIGSHAEFEKNTKHLNANYFLLYKGQLHPAEFDKVQQRFLGKGNFATRDIYL